MTKPPISRFPTPKLADLPQDIRERIATVQEKSGFVPNVFLALSPCPAEFRAFFAYHDALMDKADGLDQGYREMIVVAISGVNELHLLRVAHGAILRIREENPLIADQVATNHPEADLAPRQQGDARLRDQDHRSSSRDRRRGLRRTCAPRLFRRGRLGHRRDRRHVRDVQPARQCVLDQGHE